MKQEPQSYAGWWSELARGEVSTADAKLSAACSGVEGCRFVSFCEAGVETFGEQDPGTRCLFAKVAGPHGARRFAIPEDGLSDAISALRLWVDGVPPGSAVLLALVGVEQPALPTVLAALAPLGVPKDPPAPACRAMAAVGVRPKPGAGGWYGQPRGNHKQRGNEWRACHASSDLAYASTFLRP